MESQITSWPEIGLILAGELIFSVALAALVRLMSRHKLVGQTYWMVVVGVAGVVVISGPFIGWPTVGFLAVAFAVAAVPMGIEYFWRVLDEQRKANQAREESLQ